MSPRSLSSLTPALLLLSLLLSTAAVVRAGVPEQQAIVEGANDPVAALWQRMQRGEAKLDATSEKTFLASVLRELKIPVESQVLVFSKTSLQNSHITPRTPRAVYFNEECYVGWVQGMGGVMELIGMDGERGPQFYTLTIPTQKDEKPELGRSEQCFSCHEGSRTGNVKGMLVRSVYTDASGQPQLQDGSFLSTHESPLHERWGGWYVTGRHGNDLHMGNVTATVDENSQTRDIRLDRKAGANVLDLSPYIDIRSYLTGSSDLVALMVLEHQCTMHNLLTAANEQCRQAMLRQHEFQKAFGEKVTDSPQGSALGVFNSHVDKLLHHLLFCGEYELKDDGVEGAVAFQDAFRANRKENAGGRSLKDFQLRTRLFKDRCSYMIYSNSFEALPPQLKTMLYTRLLAVLNGTDASPDFAHLSASERENILSILRETKKDFPRQ
ncbi:hypothetical protein DES53_104259 [Roseimicrobium gellanilyticum]|uniref:Cytochrome c domain-containing protein n=1 Tax=Roseimicrobium gellanilyticum TaxID=748857 RepID=A0A366HMR1_9BACT|nr:hypothetical protein [Roseimicrobium gellanilyticum]RBP44439.1 hypothetical protein DES53_104259 [Roseimicrobium gellanilyticum]